MASSDTIYPFSLQQVAIAAWNGDGTYGTPFVLESTKTLTFADKGVSDRAEGNAGITALARQAISADCQLDTAGLVLDSLKILIGQTPQSSGTGANAVYYTSEDNARAPYFGCLAQAWPDTGDTLLWFPRCKITTDFTWKYEFGKIVVPVFKFEAIKDKTLGYTWRLYERNTANNTLVLPPLPAA